jgi:hypothetical protein
VRADWARLSGSWTARIDQRIAEPNGPLVAHPLHRLWMPSLKDANTNPAIAPAGSALARVTG